MNRFNLLNGIPLSWIQELRTDPLATDIPAPWLNLAIQFFTYIYINQSNIQHKQ